MGAGGFFGDSENAWNSSVKNISMAAKMLRVYEALLASMERVTRIGPLAL